MITLPAPLLRGLSVLAVGAALTLGHITLAAAAEKPVRLASATLSKITDVEATGSTASGRVLAENCYVEVVRETTAMGKILTYRIHECD